MWLPMPPQLPRSSGGKKTICMWSAKEILMTKNKSGYNCQSRRISAPKGEISLLPSGVFIIACCILHGFDAGPFPKRVAKLLVDGFLAAAYEAGYAGTKILETLIANNDLGSRTREMCREAVAKIPDQVISRMYKNLGLEDLMPHSPDNSGY
jgi:hypothetical protein